MTPRHPEPHAPPEPPELSVPPKPMLFVALWATKSMGLGGLGTSGRLETSERPGRPGRTAGVGVGG